MTYTASGAVASGKPISFTAKYSALESLADPLIMMMAIATMRVGQNTVVVQPSRWRRRPTKEGSPWVLSGSK